MGNLLLTGAQMRALEQAAIATGKVTGLELMERAGRGAVEAILAEWPELAAAPARAVVLCGPGNNGGDGFVVARLLSGQGWDVDVFLYGEADRLPPDARVNYERWCEMGEARALTLPRPEKRETDELVGRAKATLGDRGPALIVDALFGVGLTRPIDGLLPVLDEIQLLDGGSPSIGWPRIVCLDLPSGLCGDSGRPLGRDPTSAIAGHLTLAFGYLKPAHVLASGVPFCGMIRLIDIGIDPRLWVKTLGRPSEREDGRRFDFTMIARQEDDDQLKPGFSGELGYLDKGYGERKRSGHKYDHGHALILTGGMGRTGAARLAARGALRVGAGLVTCGAPGAAMMECAAQLTAIMLRRCDEAVDLEALLEDERIKALCVGPGAGVSARVSALLDVALASGRGIVLDADALTVLADREAPFEGVHDGCVLTPHGGEFARLFPDIAARLATPAQGGPAYSKIDATRDAAMRAGCTVLFKGPDTVIADPDGNARVSAALYERSAPWLATAGSGDVLAGFITGLLVQGMGPLEAASTAAWLHVEAARAFGPGLIAEDLPEALPGVLRALETG